MPTTTPASFSQKHFDLARLHGILPEQIIFFSNIGDMRSIAMKFDVSPVRAAEHHELTAGLCIRPEPGDSFDSTRILLRNPLPPGEHLRTYLRLGIHDPSDAFLDENRPDLLYTFLLLHEIGHHLMKHDHRSDYTTIEREADAWAYQELVRSGFLS